MKVGQEKIPYILDSLQYIQSVSLEDDITVTIVYKQLFRSDDIIVDIYLNEISEDTKIISGVKLTGESLVCYPKYSIDFTYRIDCVDVDGMLQPLTKYNADKFYLLFSTEED